MRSGGGMGGYTWDDMVRSSCRVLIRGKIIIEAIWAEVVR
jgi:hypothetical protein